MTAALKFNLNPRTLGAILLGAVVVVAAAGWLLVVSPKRAKVSKLDASVQSTQSEIATAQRAAQVPTGGVSPAVQSKSAGKALPSELAMPDVVDQLNTLAKKAGVSLDTVTPSPAQPGTGYEAVPMNIVVDGHYFGVERFLQLVRTQVRLGKNHVAAHGRLFDVQGVQLQQTEPAPMVTATVSVRTFYYSQSAAPPPPPALAPTDATAG